MKRNGEICYGQTSVRSIYFQMIVHTMYEGQKVKNSNLDSQKIPQGMGAATSWCMEGFLVMGLVAFLCVEGTFIIIIHAAILKKLEHCPLLAEINC